MAAARVFLTASGRLAGQVAAASKYVGRTYAAAATRREPATSSTAGAAASRLATAADKEDVFWMRDPKTGCWKPENHFDDVDAADLRAQQLCSKN